MNKWRIKGEIFEQRKTNPGVRQWRKVTPQKRAEFRMLITFGRRRLTAAHARLRLRRLNGTRVTPTGDMQFRDLSNADKEPGIDKLSLAATNVDFYLPVKFLEMLCKAERVNELSTAFGLKNI